MSLNQEFYTFITGASRRHFMAFKKTLNKRIVNQIGATLPSELMEIPGDILMDMTGGGLLVSRRRDQMQVNILQCTGYPCIQDVNSAKVKKSCD